MKYDKQRLVRQTCFETLLRSFGPRGENNDALRRLGVRDRLQQFLANRGEAPRLLGKLSPRLGSLRFTNQLF